MSIDHKDKPGRILNAADFAAECRAMGYPQGITRPEHILPDPRRVQCEAIALKIYEQLDKINMEANYAGQVQQCEGAVTGEWCIRVADIIQKELEWK